MHRVYFSTTYQAHRAESLASRPAFCPGCVPRQWATAGQACTQVGSVVWLECKAWGTQNSWLQIHPLHTHQCILWKTVCIETFKMSSKQNNQEAIKLLQATLPESVLLGLFSTLIHSGFRPWRPVLTILTAFSLFWPTSRETWQEKGTPPGWSIHWETVDGLNGRLLLPFEIS